jgi:hypothetical protein
MNDDKSVEYKRRSRDNQYFTCGDTLHNYVFNAMTYCGETWKVEKIINTHILPITINIHMSYCTEKITHTVLIDICVSKNVKYYYNWMDSINMNKPSAYLLSVHAHVSKVIKIVCNLLPLWIGVVLLVGLYSIPTSAYWNIQFVVPTLSYPLYK